MRPPDGSVIVSDRGDDAVVLLTAAGDRRPLGGRGNGPGENQAPGDDEGRQFVERVER